jgi:hypothetical protein
VKTLLQPGMCYNERNYGLQQENFVYRREVCLVTEKIEQYKERLNLLQEKGGLNPDSEELLIEMLAELTELNRSNKALRRVILKTGQGSSMSTRLRDALYE